MSASTGREQPGDFIPEQFCDEGDRDECRRGGFLLYNLSVPDLRQN